MDTEPYCLQLIKQGVTVKADADISGIGVISAFLFSAYATLLVTLIAYGFGLVDEGLLRPVDRLVLRVPRRAAKHVRIHVTLRKVLLALSDQQIVTGIAILGAGIQGLRTGSINVYHFQTVVYLAWMSSSVHLSALTLLRPFLHFHRGLMIWRITGMLVLLVMLLIALVPTVSNDWGVVSIYIQEEEDIPKNQTKSALGVPANCFWGHTWGDGANPDAILSFIVLLVSYIWKMGGLFLAVRKRFGSFFRSPIDHWLERLVCGPAKRYDLTGRKHWLLGFWISMGIYLPMTAFLETLASFSAALWLSTLGVVYGTMQILIPRELVQKVDMNLQQSESEFNFGQLVPLILLVQPLGAATEHIWNKVDDETSYEDFGGRSDPYGGTLGTHQDGTHIINLPDIPLLQSMATYSVPPLRVPGPQRMSLRAFLYTSRVFHSLVWITQIAVAVTAGVVFYADYNTIGYTSSNNWYIIVFGMAGWLMVCPTMTLVLAPWSRLGQYQKRKSRAEMLKERKKRSEAHDFPLQAADSEATTTGAFHDNKIELDRIATSSASIELSGQDGEFWAREWRRELEQYTKPPSRQV